MRQTLLLFTNASSAETKPSPMGDVITIPMRACVLGAKNNTIEALFDNTKVCLQGLNEYFKEPRNTLATLSLWR
ncbi:MAG TPA: hypothetical protein EYG22_01005 [Candidatus Thioglobus sp.]|jgi:hypothetical protein|nr:hypothetical protein [Candidatus Thioglobus sp.]